MDKVVPEVDSEVDAGGGGADVAFVSREEVAAADDDVGADVGEVEGPPSSLCRNLSIEKGEEEGGNES